MKIGIFNWRDLEHPQAGGAELYLYEQAKIWAKNGHEIIWFTSAIKGKPKKERKNGINFYRHGSKLGVYFYAPIYYHRFMKDCQVIIDAENGIPFFTPLYCKKKKVLLIHHIHKDVWFKEIKFPFSWIGYFLEIKLMPLIYKNTEIITVSPSSEQEIRKIFPKNDIKIIYNAIDKNCKPKRKSNEPSLVFIGRLKRYKSIDILLRAISLLDKNLEVNILGDGDDLDRLEMIKKKLDLKNVNFKGFVSETEKINFLQKAWISINPSFIEGWSITNIEANACGTVVIGSNVRGIKDSIINNKTGLLFEYGNEKELAKKIKELLKDRVKRKEMEKEAIKWAKNFSWKKSANIFLKILNGL